MADPITLYTYQEDAYRFLLARRRAYLADAPRLGKTDPTCKALLSTESRRVLVICPAGVQDAWRKRLEAWGVRGARVYSYDYAMENAEQLARWVAEETSVCVLDEAHYLANRTARRTKAILGRVGPARLATYTWCLSGTPMAKHPGQLFPVLASLFPGVLQQLGVTKYDAFLERYTAGINTTVRGKSVYKPMRAKNAGELNAVLFERSVGGSGEWEGSTRYYVEPPFLRRTGNDEVEWEIVPVPGPAHLGMPVDAIGTVDANEARQRAGEEKLPAVLEALSQKLADGEPLIIFAHYQDTLQRLGAWLHRDGRGYAYIDGATTIENRAAQVAAFQGRQCQVFLGSIRACATGITLDAADEVWIVEPDWTADVNVQAGRRAVSTINKRPTRVKMFVLKDSIDEAIIRRHRRELAMHGAVLDPGVSEEADAETFAVLEVWKR
jgi:SWI/SNF-related matrix-associated actin-dependent regulator 1 of chromatin subfamily A